MYPILSLILVPNYNNRTRILTYDSPPDFHHIFRDMKKKSDPFSSNPFLLPQAEIQDNKRPPKLAKASESETFHMTSSKPIHKLYTTTSHIQYLWSYLIRQSMMQYLNINKGGTWSSGTSVSEVMRTKGREPTNAVRVERRTVFGQS